MGRLRVKELENEHGIADKNEVIKRAMKRGMSRKQAEDAIEKLRQDGHIYCPKFTRKKGKFKCKGFKVV